MLYEELCYLVEFETIVQDSTLRCEEKFFSHFVQQIVVSSFVSNQKFSLSKVYVGGYWFYLCASQISQFQSTVHSETNKQKYTCWSSFGITNSISFCVRQRIWITTKFSLVLRRKQINSEKVNGSYQPFRNHAGWNQWRALLASPAS